MPAFPLTAAPFTGPGPLTEPGAGGPLPLADLPGLLSLSATFGADLGLFSFLALFFPPFGLLGPFPFLTDGVGARVVADP